MSAKDRPVSQPATDKYRDGHDRIFGKKEQSKPEPEPAPSCQTEDSKLKSADG